MFWVKFHAATLQGCKDKLEWAVSLFNVSSHLSEAVRLWETSKRVDEVLSNQNLMSKKTQRVLTNQFLESLPRAKYASFDCERPDKPSTCFEGTRTAILKLITDWVTDPDPTTPHFFWLNGIAGIGKTTVACTIAKLMQDLGLLGGQFCFSRRGQAELRDPALVFPTIAYQLARFDPEFARRITEALEADPEAPYSSLKQQLDRLIIDPLAGLTRDPKCVVVLIFDAFDECERRGAEEIVRLLIAALPSLPVFLKIFITSRPERHLRSVLIPATNLRITALHEIETSVVKSDILLYLRHCLRKLGEERGLPTHWIKQSDIELLADKAGNLFILAATVMRFLLQPVFHPPEQLKHLINILSSPKPGGASTARPFADLDQLYEQILFDLCTPPDDPGVAERLRLVLGSVIFLQDLLPVDALERLIGLEPGGVFSTLSCLHSVILTPSPPDDCPRAYHPSFSDFLQDRARCPDNRIWVNTEEHEGRMAIHCLDLLNSMLHKGMLGELCPTLLNNEVVDLATRIGEVFPLELQYACRYWASHLTNASWSNTDVQTALELFATRFLLPWMEAMSWLGDTGLAVRCLEAVNAWQANSTKKSTAATLLNEAYRLLVAYRPTIALGAQHLATSVLPFAPRNANLTARYVEYINPQIAVLQGVEPDWSPCLMVWKGQSLAGTVRSVAYSPEGLHAASASGGNTIQLWDPATGSCTATLAGHSSIVVSVTFSPDGTVLASSSYDHAVRTWDTTTGACIATLTGHSSGVNSVAFSNDGSRLASGSDDSTIRLWDSTTKTIIATLQGHSEGVNSVSFSPDGSTIASGSQDKTIRIWDLTGRCINILEGHSGIIHSVTFSPDGTHLASGSEDSTVRIWDMAANRCTFTFKGHSHEVGDVAFSADDARLASASDDTTIRVWNTATGQCIDTFRGHSAQVSSIAFSPDGTRIMSGSWDDTVRIWDTTHINSTIMSDGHSNRITSVAFSKDGSRLASASDDHTACIWDATTGRCARKLEGHSDILICVTFDSDGSRIATGSGDRTVRLWDANTGECTAILPGHSNWVRSLAFSSRGNYLRSADDLQDIRYWNVSEAEQVQNLNDNLFREEAPSRFRIEDGRLIRTYGAGSQRLICILPPGTPSCSVSSVDLDGSRHRVAIGCSNGNLFILEIFTLST